MKEEQSFTPNTAQGMPRTVRDALELYASLGRLPELKAQMKSLLDEMVRAGSDAELHNDSFVDALLLTGAMIRSATFSFCMMIGQGVDLFLGALKDDLEEMLRRFERGSGFARVVLVSANPSPLLEDIRKRHPDVFDFRRTTAKPGKEVDVRHFTVTDMKSYRLEHPHGPIGEDSEADCIKAEVCFNGPDVATERTQYFNRVWDYLSDAEG